MSFIQGAVQHLNVSASNALAFSLNNTAGNLLVVDVVGTEPFGGAGSLSISDSNGNTYTQIGPNEQNNVIATCWYASNCVAGANTVTVSYSGGTFANQGIAVAIHEYSGIATTSPLDTSNFNDANSISNVTASVTTSQGDLIHVFASSISPQTVPYTDSLV